MLAQAHGRRKASLPFIQRPWCFAAKIVPSLYVTLVASTF